MADCHREHGPQAGIPIFSAVVRNFLNLHVHYYAKQALSVRFVH